MAAHIVATAATLNASPRPSSPRAARSYSSLFSLAIIVLTLVSPQRVAHAAAGETISLSFLDASGASIGEPQVIPWGECVNLDSTKGAYSSVSSSNPQAALNLYSSEYCQILAASTVGNWPNTGNVASMAAIRWEGTAPSSLAPGTVRPEGFPKGMVVQTQVPKSEGDNEVWSMDPAKGQLLVGLVSGVLAVGVLIGVYQVYRAAQYVPPPQTPKKQTGLNTKKIKKKDAYYKKPAKTPMDDDLHYRQQQALQRSQYNESPEPLLSRPQMMERGGQFGSSSRDSQYSEAATFVDWEHQQQQLSRSKLYHPGADAVSIDMRETNINTHTGSRLSPFRDQHNSSTAELIQFANHDNSGYNRGRGGEVLVPMHTFDSNHHYNYNTSSQHHQHSSFGKNAAESKVWKAISSMDINDLSPG
ncbi:hypothetical protein EDD11_007484 [Mortierella claussenii]|nr:hypothetical protein EDD11_007484 [Mortierella claussenii]